MEEKTLLQLICLFFSWLRGGTSLTPPPQLCLCIIYINRAATGPHLRASVKGCTAGLSFLLLSFKPHCSLLLCLNNPFVIYFHSCRGKTMLSQEIYRALIKSMASSVKTKKMLLPLWCRHQPWHAWFHQVLFHSILLITVFTFFN